MLLKKERSAPVASPWDEDRLDRKLVANYLTPIIGSIRQPFVISLNSPYGTGKTFFVRHWKAQLAEEGYKVVYFNAWETDYTEDALIAFIGSIKDQLEADSKKTGKKLDELAKRGGAYLTRKIIPIVAKGVARKAIGSEAVEELADLASETDEDIIDFFGELAEDSLRKHEIIKASIEAFRKYLEDLVQEITKKADHEDKHKIIIFVDELDRCKPTYAVEVLECIKHLFSVNGVVFVLAIDEVQLQNSFSSVYGMRLNGEDYLKKFIDWRLHIPAPSKKKYAEYLFEKFGLWETGKFIEGGDAMRGKRDLINAFGEFSEYFDLSLRQQAQCFTEINLAVRSMGNFVPNAYILGVLAVLRATVPNIKEYCLGLSPVEVLIDILEPKFYKKDTTAGNMRGTDMKSWFHAWFVTRESRDALNNERTKIYARTNEISASGKTTNNKEYDDLKGRAYYIDRVVSIYDAFDRQYPMSCSFAESAYRFLDATSFLMERQR